MMDLLWVVLSAVWTLILTAPIHSRGSTGEQVMQCYISLKSVLMKKQTHLHKSWTIAFFNHCSNVCSLLLVVPAGSAIAGIICDLWHSLISLLQSIMFWAREDRPECISIYGLMVDPQMLTWDSSAHYQVRSPYKTHCCWIENRRRIWRNWWFYKTQHSQKYHDLLFFLFI